MGPREAVSGWGMGLEEEGDREPKPQCSVEFICIHYVRFHFWRSHSHFNLSFIVNIQSRNQIVCADMLPWFQTAPQTTAVLHYHRHHHSHLLHHFIGCSRSAAKNAQTNIPYQRHHDNSNICIHNFITFFADMFRTKFQSEVRSVRLCIQTLHCIQN